MFAPRRLSLRARLLWLAVLSTAAIVSVTSFLEKRLIEDAVETEALDAAGATALGVAADITEREELPSAQGLEDLLARFSKAEPSLRALTLVEDRGGAPVVRATTDENEFKGATELAHKAEAGRVLFVAPPDGSAVRYVAAPLERNHRPYGAVIASISLESVERVRKQTRALALAFGALATLGLTTAIHFLAGRLVYRPLDVLHQTMTRAAQGDLEARAALVGRDEFGELASGLNAMLERLGDFNKTLQQEVTVATSALNEQKLQLLEANQKLFAARRELARGEQLAVAGQMAASVAHQIGTPLNLISGYVQMMLSEQTADAVSAARLTTVQAQIARVTQIVQRLLQHTRRPAPALQEVDVATLILEVCELARPTLDAKKITLSIDVAHDTPALFGDRSELQEVLLNLMTNSIDAMEAGGALTIRARADAGEVEIQVSDTGVGIPADVLPRVFEPLFTTKAEGKGTGLGLAIVRDIVQASGGTVAVASDSGEGTKVSLRFPAAKRVVATGA